MPITGAHMLFYTSEADAVRDVLRNHFGWNHVDTGGGWLIFEMPPAEIGVHPADRPGHEISLMCDDLTATMTELARTGVSFAGEPREEEWGTVVTMVLPGGLHVSLYEAHHPTAI